MDFDLVEKQFLAGGVEGGREKYGVWFDRLRNRSGAVLPRNLGDGGAALYLLADNPEGLRAIRYIALQAFGRSWLGESGSADPAKPAGDSFDETLKATGVLMKRLEIRKEHFGRVKNAYRRLTELERRRPQESLQRNYSAGELLRTLRRSVESADLEAAKAALHELGVHELLEAYNLEFLEAWVVCRLQPESLFGSTCLERALSHQRVPADFLRSVGDALLQRVRASAESDGVSGAVATYKDLAGVGLGSRLQSLSGHHGACFEILDRLECDDGKIEKGVLDEARGSGALPDSVLEQAQELSSEGQPAAALQCLEEGRHQEAVQLLRQEGPSEEGLRVLLQSASSGHGGALTLADEWWKGASEEQQRSWHLSNPLSERLFSSVPGEGRGLAQVQTITSWLEWIEAVLESDSGSAAEEADFHWNQWPFIPDPSDPDQWRRMNRALQAGDDEVITRVRPYFGGLLDSWEACEDSKHAGTVCDAMVDLGLLALLIDIDTLNAGRSIEDLHGLLNLASRWGMSSRAYGDLVETLAERVRETATASLLGSVADVLEALLGQKCPNKDALKTLASALAQASLSLQHRLTGEVKWVIGELLIELGRGTDAEALRAVSTNDDRGAEGEEGHTAGTDGRDLSGVKIGIYTLEPKSGQRVRERLEAKYGADVQLNDDHAASEALKGMLQWADYVVMVKRAAQHAATDEIRRRITDDKLVQPRGKGSSSILRDLFLHLDMYGDV